MTFTHADAAVYAWHLREVARWRVAAITAQRIARAQWQSEPWSLSRANLRWRSHTSSRTLYSRARSAVDKWLAADAALRTFLARRPS